MNDTHIRCFLALAEYENYTEVARRLFISQPVVSKYISLLEQEWGVPLFYRTKRDVSITAEGRIILDAMQQIKTLYDQGILQAQKICQAHSDQLNIAFLQSIDIADELRFAIREIMEEQPSLQLSLDCLSHKELNQGLEDGNIDIAVTLEHEVRHDPNMDCITLMTMKQCIVTSKSHALAQKTRLNTALLKQQRFFAVKDGSFGYKQYVELLQHEFGIKPDQIKHVPDIDSLLLNVESGLGVALLSNLIRLSGDRNIRMFPMNHLDLDIVTAWKKDDDKRMKNEFVKLLVKALQKKPASS